MRERPFSCGVCGQNFRRHEHLSRHAISHNKEKNYLCHECGKSFTRRDTLSRHATMHRQDAEGLRYSGAIRACRWCAGRRIRCSRGVPCDQCVKKGLVCHYSESLLPDNTTTVSNSDIPALNSRTWAQQEQHQNIEFDSNISAVETETAQPHSLDQMPQTPAVSAEESRCSANTGDPMNFAFTFQSENEHVPGALEILPFDLLGMTSSNHIAAGLNWWVPDLSDFDEEILGQYSNRDWQSASERPMDDVQGLNAQQSPATIASSANQNPDLSQVSSRIEVSFASGTLPSILPAAVESLNNVSDASVPQGSEHAGLYGKYYVDGTAGRIGLPGAHKTVLCHSLNEQGQFGRDRTLDANVHSARSSISSEKIIFSIALYNELISGLRMTLGHEFEQCHQKNFPSSSAVESFLHNYFDYFHLTYPFLRRADFQYGTISWVVVLAAAAIGSHICRSRDAYAMHSILASVLRKRLSSTDWLDLGRSPHKRHGRDESRNADLSTIQATILNLILVLNNSAENWESRTLMGRTYLVERCEAMGLLEDYNGRPSLSQEDDQESQLHYWLQSQAGLRTGLMIWLLDTVLAYQTGSAFRLMSLKATVCLPAADTIWESSISEPSSQRIKTVRLLDALEEIWIHKRIPADMTSFSCMITVLAICRKVRDIKWQDKSRLFDFIACASAPGDRGQPTKAAGFPTAEDLFNKWRNSACDALDVLHWETNSQIARCAGWEPPCILYLHLSRLLIMAPVSHLRLLADDPFLRSQRYSKQQDWTDDSRAEARLHITRWALQDCFKARLCLIHAGALYWHVRRFRIMGISEPFGVYLATLVLWAYSIVGQLSLTSAQALSARNRLADNSRDNHSNVAQSGNCHNKDSEELPFIYLDRPCDDEMVQIFVRGEHRTKTFIHGVGDIRASDAANKILGEGQRLLKAVDGLKSSDTMPSNMPKQSHQAWTLHKRYIESLAHLQGRNT